MTFGVVVFELRFVGELVFVLLWREEEVPIVTTLMTQMDKVLHNIVSCSYFMMIPNLD
jgi:hypothetical protein